MAKVLFVFFLIYQVIKATTLFPCAQEVSSTNSKDLVKTFSSCWSERWNTNKTEFHNVFSELINFAKDPNVRPDCEHSTQNNSINIYCGVMSVGKFTFKVARDFSISLIKEKYGLDLSIFFKDENATMFNNGDSMMDKSFGTQCNCPQTCNCPPAQNNDRDINVKGCECNFEIPEKIVVELKSAVPNCTCIVPPTNCSVCPLNCDKCMCPPNQYRPIPRN